MRTILKVIFLFTFTLLLAGVFPKEIRAQACPDAGDGCGNSRECASGDSCQCSINQDQCARDCNGDQNCEANCYTNIGQCENRNYGPPPGGGICNSCGSPLYFGITSIQDYGSYMVVNWNNDVGGWNQACYNSGKYHYVIYIGTDYNAINGNCNGTDGNNDYRGVGGTLPLGCLYSRSFGNGSVPISSYNTSTASPPIVLYPSTVYYTKVVVVMSNPNVEFYSQCFGSLSPFSSACTISPSSATVPIGGPPVKFTTSAFTPGNGYAAPTPVTTSLSWTAGYCPGKEVDGICNVQPVPGYFVVYGYHFGNPGDQPNIRIYQHGTNNLIYDGIAWPWTISNDNLATDYGHITFTTDYQKWSWGSYDPSLLTASDVTVYYPPPTSFTFPNNIDHIDFLQYPAPPPTYISINPTSDTSNPYETFVTGVAVTNPVTALLAKIYAKTATGSQSAWAACLASIAVSNVQANPWWQVKDSDVQSNGDLTSTIPSGNYFGIPGPGGFPGVSAYSGATNLTGTNVAAAPSNWLAQSPWSNPKQFDYAFFSNKIPSDVSPKSITSVNDTSIAAGDPTQYGYAWYKYDGAANGGLPLTVDSATHISSKKVILLVDNADFDINNTIHLADSQGFFMAIVNGNINVSPGVGGGGAVQPNMEGLYVADGTFSDGTFSPSVDSQLWVRGSVVAYGGVSLQRDLLAGNSSPAEVFEYAPDQIMLFPSVLGYRKISWKEVAP